MPAEALADRGEMFDVVVASEVIEHVKRPDEFVATLTRLMRPEARTPLIISTINRTPAAFALAVVAAEYVLHIVPKGTHHW